MLSAVLLLLDARRLPLSIDVSRPHGTQQQTRCTSLLLSIDGTDGQTDARPFHRPCSAYSRGSDNKRIYIIPKQYLFGKCFPPQPSFASSGLTPRIPRSDCLF